MALSKYIKYFKLLHPQAVELQPKQFVIFSNRPSWMISDTPNRSVGMQEAFFFSCTFIHCSTFNHLLYTQNWTARAPETRRSADRFPSYKGRLSVANVLVLRTPEMMISSGGVSLSLKICASSLRVQRYDSPFTPRFCLAGRNPRFCGTKARQTPAVRLRLRRRLNLLWSSLLANVRETQTQTGQLRACS